MRERLRIAMRGAVQGVGFRPFVHRLAGRLDLDGWVRNSPQGVFIEVEGPGATLDEFLRRLEVDPPPRAVIQSLESTWLDPVPYRGFEIRESARDGGTTALVLPDIAMCDDCRRDIDDPANRRHRYPFTNCTNCGPRFSIIDALPYDRARTSMRAFAMCPDCLAEYHDPANRRFHAQPNACPACGPQLALWDQRGRTLAAADDALLHAARAIRQGRIVALKGVGGFHLIANAGDEAAVLRLRARKHREEKPLAVMYPSLDLVRRECSVSAVEARVLASPEAPIVLLRRQVVAPAAVAPSVAPGNPLLGVMLPYSPLHHLLVSELGAPIVATSGNLSDEPICTDGREALDRLGGVADLFLVHDRPIVRHVDDSIVRVVLGRELVMRRARGYAPLPVPIRGSGPDVIAVGAHLKNTVAATSGPNVFISQHIGDLESPRSFDAFRSVIADFTSLFHLDPAVALADAHPDYLSTKYAADLGLPVVHVQHHLAHVAACLAENDLTPPALGVAWDGTGYGPDGSVWGGEFLAVRGASWERVACLRPFRLPGGDAAIREPRRSAFGLLHAMFGGDVIDLDLAPVRVFEPAERRLMLQALGRGVNAPVTTSAGRLFDAVSAIIGLRQRANFEGQAAMALEWAVREGVDDSYPFGLGGPPSRAYLASWQAPEYVIDWAPSIHALIGDLQRDVSAGVMAAKFHNTLAAMITAVARRVGESRVALTGGCFQNGVLVDRTVTRLREAGFMPYWHQRVPPNDGGIAFGQVAAYVYGYSRPRAGQAERMEPLEGPALAGPHRAG
jgi:hydrogenase maturation protein HypF